MKAITPSALFKHSAGSPVSMSLAFLLGLVLPALLYVTYTVNYHAQNDRVEDNAYQITQDMSQGIAEVKTIMASLIGLHYASSESGRSNMSLFAKELREQTDFVTGIGRYQNIQHEERADFESQMVASGVEDFQIRDINLQGLTLPRTYSSSYFPISMLEPVRPDNELLLGADLSVISSLGKNLESVSAFNSPLLASFPARWPSGGDLVFFAPVYDGKAVPTMPAERAEQYAGGFWISISLERLFAGVNPNIKEFDVTAKIHTDDASTMLFGQLGRPAEPYYLTSLYLRKVSKEDWTAGGSTLTITLQQDLGFTKSGLVYFFCALLFLVVLTAIFTVFILARRAAIQQNTMAQIALFTEREKAEKTLNTVQDAIIALDSDMRVGHINPAAATQFKLSQTNVIGSSLSNIAQFRLEGETYSLLNIETELEKLDPNRKAEFNVTPVGHHDKDFILRLTMSSSMTPEGVITGHVLVLRNISQERRLSKKLAYQANHDSLTGCKNRHSFENTLEKLIESLPETEQTHTLCYMDLDQFKIVNDTNGHAAGDQLLIELTQNINSILGEKDILARLGGDEFGILMRDVSHEEAKERTEKLFDYFQTYIFHHDGKSFAVRASIGVVHLDKNSSNLKAVLASADMACYAAKESGRNSLYVYSETDDAIAERSKELSWLPRLQKALQEDQFCLMVQAVASVEALCNHDAHAIEHYEFLLRLKNADGSLSTPWQFIQAAERYDLMTEIDRWVISHAFGIVASLKNTAGSDSSFSINLSGQSAADPTLKTFIQEQLEKHQVDPSKIWFELTETAAISQFSVAVDLIESVQSMGFLVALDDFGAGLSSFGYLKNLPVDVLKIDGQFVKEIANNSIDREMVRAIHQVGQSMGIQTVAEFVEDEAIVQVLSDIGVQYAQGYHIGKPCPIETAMAQHVIDIQRAA